MLGGPTSAPRGLNTVLYSQTCALYIYIYVFYKGDQRVLRTVGRGAELALYEDPRRRLTNWVSPDHFAFLYV